MTNTKNSVSENVNQGNKVSRGIYKMDSLQQNLTYFALYKLEKAQDIIAKELVKFGDEEGAKKVDLQNYEASFTLKEMCEIMGIKYNIEKLQNYKKCISEMAKLIIKVIDEKKIVVFPLFSKIEYEKESTNFKIMFNPEALFYLTYRKNYSTANMRIIGEISENAKDNYAQRLYFYLLSFRGMKGEKYHQKDDSTWTVTTTPTELKTMLQTEKDENQRTDSFTRMIKQRVARINKHNFEFSIEVATEGRPLERIIFTCHENEDIIRKRLPDGRKGRYETIAFNNEQKEMAYYKKRHAAEWKDIEAELLADRRFASENASLLRLLEPKTRRTFIDARIFGELKRRHGIESDEDLEIPLP